MQDRIKSLVESLARRLDRWRTQDIVRAIWITAIAVVFSALLFGGYYYWDRYVHLGDQSPIEIDIGGLEQAVRDNPNDPESRLDLAQHYLNAGRFEEALEQATVVLAAYPSYEGALLISGMAYAYMEQPEEAVSPLAEFVRLRSQHPALGTDILLETGYYFLGESYVKLAQYEEAVPVLEAALAIDAVDADALYQLGLAYHYTGQLEAAVERYHGAVRLVPDFLEVYQGMIESYAALDQPDHVQYARGMEAFCLGDYGTARTLLVSSTQALPDFAPAFLGLGLTYEQLGEMELALAVAQRALELNAHDFVAQQMFERLHQMVDAAAGDSE